MADSLPKIGFEELLQLSRKTDKVNVDGGLIEVHALTSAEEEHIRSIQENVRPPALKRTVTAPPAQGSPPSGEIIRQEVVDYDYEDPEYRRKAAEAEQMSLLWLVYYGTPSIKQGCRQWDGTEEERVKKLAEHLSQSVISRLVAAITILTRADEQERLDFFSDNGSSYFRNSKRSATSNVENAPPETPSNESAQSDTAESTKPTSSESAPDGGDTNSASGEESPVSTEQKP